MMNGSEGRDAPAGREVGAPARVVFMGTPDFAVPTLRALLDHHEVVAVLTQPDRPAGRGRKPRPSDVKEVALEADVEILQPATLRRGDSAAAAIARLEELAPDVIVVAAYGLILPGDVLRIGRRGALNVHASLLPRWRGAAPVHRAILAGDATTGVTIMEMDEGLDTGAIVATRETPIDPRDTVGTVTDRLAQMGADLLIDVLPDWLAGRIDPQPQDDRRATYAERVEKSEGKLDWSESAAALALRVRGLHPWPGSYTRDPDGGRIKVLEVRTVEPMPSGAPDEDGEGPPPDGTPAAAVGRGSGSVVRDRHAPAASPERLPGELVVVERDGGRWPAVATGDGLLLLERVQPAGKPAMSGDAFLRGRSELVGSVLGPAGSPAGRPHA